MKENDTRNSPKLPQINGFCFDKTQAFSIALPDGSNRDALGSGVITGILGIGGMANVYEIWNSQLEVSRAVKLLRPDCTADTKQRFQTEMKITAKLHHPYIIEIHTVGQWNGIPFIEMEKVDGFTLEQIIHDCGALSVEVCTSISIMIGMALKYAHNHEYVIYGKTYHGVIHRDLKPSNIMVTTTGSLKLMDFGIARPTDASIHTTDGSVLGTIQYLSPEQLEGRECDVRTDIYSLGAVLYELLTGVKVFPDNNVSRLMLAKIKNKYKTLDYYNLKIPSKLRSLIHCCLSHDRNKRISSADEFLQKMNAIHKSITDLTPEQILIDHFSSKNFQHTVPTLKWKIPRRIIITTVLVALIGSISPFLPKIQKRSTNEKDVTISADKPKPDTTKSGVKSLNSQEKNLVKIDAKDYKARSSSVKPIAEITQDTSRGNLVQKIAVPNETKEPDALIEDLFSNGKYQDILNLFNQTRDAMQSDKLCIYKMRALEKLGLQNEVSEFLFTREINDAEWYLERAKCLFNGNEYDKSLQELTKCAMYPSIYSDKRKIRIDRVYYIALCNSKKYYQNSTSETKKTALDSWFEVKSELQTSQDHPYFKMADTEMQHLTREISQR